MKKTLLFIPIMLMALSVFAQEASVEKSQNQKPKKMYIRVGLGGGVSTSASFDLLYKYSDNGTNSTLSVVPVGLGNGFNGAVAFGYWFNKYVGIELAVSEFMGLPTSGDSVVHIIGANKATVKVRGGMLSVVPSVVISAGLAKVNPYARFGLQIGVLPNLVSKYSKDNGSTNPPMNTQLVNQYYGGAALGYTVAGGVNFNFTKLLAFYVELQFSHATWSPNHSEVVKYTVSEEDRLSSLTTWQKQADFVMEVNTNQVIDQNQPRQELRKTYPFSTASINIGLLFKL